MANESGGTTRVALVGAGFIADTHAHALRETEGVEMAGVCDASAARAESLRRRFRISHAWTSVGEMLEAGACDLAHVLVPPPLHIEMAATLLAHGVGVFLEKPMGLSESACRQLHDLAEDRGLPLGVNQNFCFHPAFAELQSRLAANEIGPVQFVDSITNLPLRQISKRQFGHWMFRHPQNVLLEIGCHPFSMIHALLGDVRSAQTRTAETIRIGGDTEFHKVWRTHLDCERGVASAYIAVGHEYPVQRIAVIGPDGSLEANLVTGAVTRGEKTRWLEFYDLTLNDKRNAKRLRRQARRNFWGYPLALFKLRPRNDLFYAGMRASIQAFHAAVRAGAAPPVGGARGAAIIGYCEAVWSGRANGRREARVASAAVPIDVPDAEPSETVLVTGATGFIGGHTVEALLRRGYRVRAFVRSPGWLPEWLRHERVETIEGSLSNEGHLKHAVGGCAAAVHLATGLFDTWDETEAVAVGGTRLLAEICRAYGVGRLVFTSSIAALYVGSMTPDQKVTADHPLDPKPQGRSIYARAKIACEHILREEHEQHGLPVVILRPGLVVGPRGPTRHSGVGYWPRDNHCLLWGTGEHALPFVLAGDVADAIVAAVAAGGAAGKAFNLAGEVRLTARDYVAELARRSRRPIQAHPQNLWIMQRVEVFKWLVKIAARKKDNPYPSYRDLKTRALRPWVDCAAAREVLGWRPEADRNRFLELGIQRPLDDGG